MPQVHFADLQEALQTELASDISVKVKDTHAVVGVAEDKAEAAIALLEAKGLRIMGSGASMEIYKEVGLPKDVAARFGLRDMGGSHGIGHTRMATESAVTTMGAHPFSTADDQCLVHNGSLSNHNRMRRKLARQGVMTRSENDTEVGAAYISWRIAEGASLGEALEGTIDDLDGFFTFVTGTRNGFGVVRDPIACKPAVMAETDDYVAFASEYRAFADLPGIEAAKVWEPEPATVYFWER
jgi:glutamate synthase domain-containing protein 1